MTRFANCTSTYVRREGPLLSIYPCPSIPRIFVLVRMVSGGTAYLHFKIQDGLTSSYEAVTVNSLYSKSLREGVLPLTSSIMQSMEFVYSIIEYPKKIFIHVCLLSCSYFDFHFNSSFTSTGEKATHS